MSKPLPPRTPWFSVRTHPVRNGWYEYRGWMIPDSTRRYWSKGSWSGGGFVETLYSDQWRGLTEKVT